MRGGRGGRGGMDDSNKGHQLPPDGVRRGIRRRHRPFRGGFKKCIPDGRSGPNLGNRRISPTHAVGDPHRESTFVCRLKMMNSVEKNKIYFSPPPSHPVSNGTHREYTLPPSTIGIAPSHLDLPLRFRPNLATRTPGCSLRTSRGESLVVAINKVMLSEA